MLNISNMNPLKPGLKEHIQNRKTPVKSSCYFLPQLNLEVLLWFFTLREENESVGTVPFGPMV